MGYATLSTTSTQYDCECLDTCMPFVQCYDIQQAYNQVPTALVFNNNHVIYYHMDAQWSIGLAWTYFANAIWLSNVGSMLHCYLLKLLTKQSPIPSLY